MFERFFSWIIWHFEKFIKNHFDIFVRVEWCLVNEILGRIRRFFVLRSNCCKPLLFLLAIWFFNLRSCGHGCFQFNEVRPCTRWWKKSWAVCESRSWWPMQKFTRKFVIWANYPQFTPDVYPVFSTANKKYGKNKNNNSFSTAKGRVGKQPNIMLHCGWNRGNFRWMWHLGGQGGVQGEGVFLGNPMP